jgi:hypothetical protein
MIAYHGRQSIKDDVLAKLAAHRAADELIQDYGYWRDGKGCAVGCTIEGSSHAKYETEFGIPQALARIEDSIFEALPVAQARLWPERFMGAIQPGADLSLVVWKFLRRILDAGVTAGISDPIVAPAIHKVNDLLEILGNGGDISAAWAARAAERAEKAPESAPWAESVAAWAESAAACAARAAACAERAAESATWAASAATCATCAASAAVMAARDGRSARGEKAAARATWVRFSNVMIELLEAAQ